MMQVSISQLKNTSSKKNWAIFFALKEETVKEKKRINICFGLHNANDEMILGEENK